MMFRMEIFHMFRQERERLLIAEKPRLGNEQLLGQFIKMFATRGQKRIEIFFI